jgi:hypothetical protein
VVGGAISWLSKQKQIIALSSTKAKYIASASSTREVIWIKQLMKEIRFHQLGPLLLHCDNQSCIALTKNHCHDDRSKHIDIKHHYLHEKKKQKNIIVIYYPTEDMIDKVLTKALPKPKHMKCLTVMRIIELLD